MTLAMTESAANAPHTSALVLTMTRRVQSWSRRPRRAANRPLCRSMSSLCVHGDQEAHFRTLSPRWGSHSYTSSAWQCHWDPRIQNQPVR
jgi:hypothetical protein